jgi:hypothetical protein
MYIPGVSYAEKLREFKYILKGDGGNFQTNQQRKRA